ncbi:hypothetical protein [Streptomyces sp. NPDC093223]
MAEPTTRSRRASLKKAGRHALRTSRTEAMAPDNYTLISPTQPE